jgi:CorA-like Mg2+ transporter protein
MVVNCVVYEQGTRLADIPVSEVSAHLGRPGCFVWIALKDPEPGELEGLQDQFGLHELAIEDAQHGHQRPKLEEYGASLFVVLQMVEWPGAELQTGEVAVFVGPQYVISVRREAQHGFTEVRRRCEQEPELLRHGPAYVLYALMDTVVDRYFPVLDRVTEEIEEIEERIFAGDTSRAQIEALYTLKRKLLVLDHATGPLLEVAGKLHGGRVPPICAGLDRQPARHGHDGGGDEPVAHHDLRERGHQAPGGLRRAGRRADDDRRHLRHELPAHARTRLGVGLSGGAGLDGRHRRVPRLPLPPGAVDVTARRAAGSPRMGARTSAEPRAPGPEPRQ